MKKIISTLICILFFYSGFAQQNLVDAKKIQARDSLRLGGVWRSTWPTAGTASNITGLIQQGTNVTITGTGTTGSPYVINSSAGTTGWGLTGNAGTTPGTNFIGTTDGQDFVIKRNGLEGLRFKENYSTLFQPGLGNVVTGFGSISMGGNNSASGVYSMGVGVLNKVKNYGGFVVGVANDSAGVGSLTIMDPLNRIFQIGNGTANNARSNAMTVLHNGSIGFGTVSPNATVDISGSFRLANGTQGSGKILTSDASGLASWQTPSGGGGSVAWIDESFEVDAESIIPAGDSILTINETGVLVNSVMVFVDGVFVHPLRTDRFSYTLTINPTNINIQFTDPVTAGMLITVKATK